MRNLRQNLLNRETLRYLVFGVLTVVVNVVSYRLLTLTMSTLAANTVAFFIAVLFAYFTNSRYVFQVPFAYQSFLKFMSMRIGTLIIDDGGMLLLIQWGCNDVLAKCVINAAIIVLNYLLSKRIVFRKEEAGE